MISMTICNCPQRARHTNDFSPCACCSSGQHTDPNCVARINRQELPTRILELAIPEVRHSRGKRREYTPPWARRPRA